MMNNKLVSLLLLGLLSGCSLIPEYLRPAAPVAATYPAALIATASDNEKRRAAEIGWREFFPDARLQILIAAALENNRDLRIAVLRIEEARAQYNIQRSDEFPSIGGTAGYTRSRGSASIVPPGQPLISSQYQVGLAMAAFELDFFGRVRSLSAAALANYFATAEAQRAAQITLVAEVAKAYLAERTYDEQLGLAQQTLKGREQSYDLAKQRVEVGASSALDLRTAETLTESARVTVATLLRQRAQAGNALTLLVGQPSGDSPAPTALSAQRIVTDIPAGLPSDLLEQRPDIRQAEQQLRAANANIGAARAAFFPRITLTSSIGTASRDLSGLFKAGSSVWSFAPQLVVPIFESAALQSNLDLSKVRKNIAIANYEKTIQSAFRDVSDALVARGALEEQLAAQQRFRDATAARLGLADQRFQNGISSYLDVLDAQRDLFNADQVLVQTRQLRLTNAVDLYRALGGGLSEQGTVVAK